MLAQHVGDQPPNTYFVLFVPRREHHYRVGHIAQYEDMNYFPSIHVHLQDYAHYDVEQVPLQRHLEEHVDEYSNWQLEHHAEQEADMVVGLAEGRSDKGYNLIALVPQDHFNSIFAKIL